MRKVSLLGGVSRRMRPRPQRRRGIAAWWLSALVLASACGADGTDVAQDGAATVSAGTAPTSAPAPLPPLPADASAADIAGAVSAVLGPTTDPVAEAAALVELPAGIPVPAGSTVTEFHTSTTAQSATAPGASAPPTRLTETRIVVWTPAATDDAATLLRTALAGEGFVEVGASAPEPTDRTQTLEFESAELGDQLTLSVLVFDIAAAVADERVESPTSGTQVAYSLTQHGAGSVDRYQWWRELVPLPVQSTRRVAVDHGYDEPRDVTQLTVELVVGGDVETVAGALRAEVDDPGDSTAEPRAGGVSFIGDHPELGTVAYTVEPNATGDVATSAVIIRACVPTPVDGDDRRVTSQYLVWMSCEQSIGAAPTDEVAPTSTIAATAELRSVTGRSATGQELADAAAAVLGPTGDVVAAMAPFASLPGEVATPTGADIRWFETSIDLHDDGWSTAAVEMVVSGTVDDVATFYETTLAAAGYVRMAGERTGSGAAEQAALQFTLEDGGFDDVSEIAVTVGGDAFIHAAAPDSGTPVRLSFTRPVVDQGQLAGHAWGLPLPGIDAGDVTGWSVLLQSSDPDHATIDLRAAYSVPGDAADVVVVARADPPPAVEVSSRDTAEPDTLWLERAGYETLWATTTLAADAAPGEIWVMGTLPLPATAGE